MRKTRHHRSTFLVFSISFIASNRLHISNCEIESQKETSESETWMAWFRCKCQHSTSHISVHISQVIKETEPSVVYTEEFHNLSSTSWRMRKAGDGIQWIQRLKDQDLRCCQAWEDGWISSSGEHICPSSAFLFCSGSQQLADAHRHWWRDNCQTWKQSRHPSVDE